MKKTLPIIVASSLLFFSCNKQQSSEAEQAKEAMKQKQIAYTDTAKSLHSVTSLSKENFIPDRVFFNFDNASVQGRYQEDLKIQAAYIKAELAKNPNLQVVVEGNCDERGGVEYNIALGQKRAESAKQILVEQGIPASSIKTVSFGKERKLVEGSTAIAYLQNRAAITKIQK